MLTNEANVANEANDLTMDYVSSLISRREIAANTYEIRFTKPDGFSYRAGQFVNFGIEKAPYSDPKGMRRSMSLCSAPSEEDLRIAWRGSPSAFKRSLLEISIGNTFSIRGPFGHVGLPGEGSAIPLVFLSGGIGIATFRSLLRDNQSKGFPHGITLFDANRTESEIAWKDELPGWVGEKGRVIFTLTREDSPSWTGERGRIDESMIQRYVPDLGTPRFYIIGVTNMVKSLEALLLSMGVSPEKIVVEKFGDS
ncbi:MAG: oxidoreductase FAD/NAD(P)-binding protein [Parcubacteria group bacterium Gr01-1014_18]|nr:MAG: oxidoreductase FAD/NAD(P)-binding protein [Parcubacteria group bacterium Greene0416_36]TSC81133.1 MAG: oxidoreductase FAD/NAD(P)-binding protein [Parcubacteria group bacterium Gr01-1014_18]TSC98450.1 MAG: oxidoreductase FAD/NAD(P)-binding protein [Parcubacteria group bacterium Greene1014_20]TSD07384.1 MAG: oxidoreductase FAD/NAD(P)-binding protein [Parcubacteria group bacterium Greene0714_2]